jgi:hypothetical protein
MSLIEIAKMPTAGMRRRNRGVSRGPEDLEQEE